MRSLMIPAAFLLLVGCADNDKKPVEQKVASLHSAAFNQSFDAMMSEYYGLTEGFVNWDSTTVMTKSAALSNRIKSISLDDLKNDSAVYLTAQESLKNTAAAVSEIETGAGMTAKRHGLNALSQNIYDLLRAVKYDEKKLYLQKCPMAFNDSESGLWLTDKGFDVIRNPYLGLKHPKYGDAMIECGENTAIVDFVPDEKQQQEKTKVDEKVDSSHSNGKDKK